MRSLRSLNRLLLLLVLLRPASAYAQHPACVEVALPEGLPEQETWRGLLLQETRPLLAGEGGDCAKVELSTQSDD